MIVKCPFCGREGNALSSRRLSMQGWILLVALLFLCLPLFWLPFMFDACYEEVVKCSSCGMKIGER